MLINFAPSSNPGIMSWVKILLNGKKVITVTQVDFKKNKLYLQVLCFEYQKTLDNNYNSGSKKTQKPSTRNVLETWDSIQLWVWFFFFSR